jgi:hypothetical protein
MLNFKAVGVNRHERQRRRLRVSAFRIRRAARSADVIDDKTLAHTTLRTKEEVAVGSRTRTSRQASLLDVLGRG